MIGEKTNSKFIHIPTVVYSARTVLNYYQHFNEVVFINQYIDMEILYNWCDNNCIEYYTGGYKRGHINPYSTVRDYDLDGCFGTDIIVFAFLSKKDALKFKLRWS